MVYYEVARETEVVDIYRRYIFKTS